MKRITCFFLTLLFVFLLIGCKSDGYLDVIYIPNIEYQGVELEKLTYKTIYYFGGFTNTYLFDFDANTASFKSYNPIDDEETPFEVFATFDEEAEKYFINRIYTYGMFNLKEHYETDEMIMDGGGWSLKMEFKDGSIKESDGDNAGPDKVFGYCAYAFYDLVERGIVGYVDSDYYAIPTLSYSVVHRMPELIYSTDSFFAVNRVNYQWNKKSITTRDLYTISSVLNQDTKLLASAEYSMSLSTWNYGKKEKFTEFKLWSYDLNEELSNEKLVLSKGWFSQIDIDLEPNKIYMYQLTFKDGDFVQYTFNTRVKTDKILFGTYQYSLYDIGNSTLKVKADGTFSLSPFDFSKQYLNRTGIEVDPTIPTVTGTYDFEVIKGCEYLCFDSGELGKLTFRFYALSFFLEVDKTTFDLERYNLIPIEENKAVYFLYQFNI